MKKVLDTIKKDWFIIVIIALTFIVSLYFYPELPSKIPSHWNSKGEIDGYSGKFFGTFLMPLINLSSYFMFLLLPYLDPKKENYEKFKSSYKVIRNASIILFAGIQVIILLVALGHTVDVVMLIGVGTSLLFVVIGNVMGKFKHNYFVGIKTPWTLANEEVWVKTHRMAAPLWVVGGIISAIFAIIGPEMYLIALMTIIPVIAIAPMIYSYVIFKKLNKIQINK